MQAEKQIANEQSVTRQDLQFIVGVAMIAFLLFAYYFYTWRNAYNFRTAMDICAKPFCDFATITIPWARRFSRPNCLSKALSILRSSPSCSPCSRHWDSTLRSSSGASANPLRHSLPVHLSPTRSSQTANPTSLRCPRAVFFSPPAQFQMGTGGCLYNGIHFGNACFSRTRPPRIRRRASRFRGKFQILSAHLYRAIYLSPRLSLSPLRGHCVRRIPHRGSLPSFGDRRHAELLLRPPRFVSPFRLGDDQLQLSVLPSCNASFSEGIGIRYCHASAGNISGFRPSYLPSNTTRDRIQYCGLERGTCLPDPARAPAQCEPMERSHSLLINPIYFADVVAR